MKFFGGNLKMNKKNVQLFIILLLYIRVCTERRNK